MTLDPPHMVVRTDTQSVNSPYWQQNYFAGAYSSGVGPVGVNPYGPDEGTTDIVIPFSPAEARHQGGMANVVFLDGHTASLTLAALGYSFVTPASASGSSSGYVYSPYPQCQLSAKPLPGADNSLWTGRGLDEYSPSYSIDSP